jgi:hypothetical protein
MDPTPVKVKLSNIHCYDEGDGIGTAEPYLWTVFFKIDGETAHVDAAFNLQGTATVVTTPGNHGDLGPGGVDAGNDVPIPPSLGEFSTVLQPIPVDGQAWTLPGVVGCIAILMEQDSTSDSAVAHGHDTLNQAVQDALDALIPTLNAGHTEPTDAEIKALTDKVGSQLENAISDQVSAWDWLKVAGNMDDKIGAAVFYKSQDDIIKALLDGIPIEQEWENEGDWKISGRINAVIDSLEVACIHKPSGNPEAHHIERVGGTYNGEDWRLTTAEVIRWLQAAFSSMSRAPTAADQLWRTTNIGLRILIPPACTSRPSPTAPRPTIFFRFQIVGDDSVRGGQGRGRRDTGK